MDAVTLLSEKYHSILKKDLDNMGNNPMIPLLVQVTDKQESGNNCPVTAAVSMCKLFDKAKNEDSPEATASLLYAIFSTEVDSTFHKINVHAAMTPADVRKLFEPIFRQANFFLDSKREKPEDTLIVTVRARFIIIR